jgi:hypothetical protein
MAQQADQDSSTSSQSRSPNSNFARDRPHTALIDLIDAEDPSKPAPDPFLIGAGQTQTSRVCLAPLPNARFAGLHQKSRASRSATCTAAMPSLWGG